MPNRMNHRKLEWNRSASDKDGAYLLARTHVTGMHVHQCGHFLFVDRIPVNNFFFLSHLVGESRALKVEVSSIFSEFEEIIPKN